MIGKGARELLIALIAGTIAVALLGGCGSGSESGTDQFRDQTDSRLLDFGEEGDAEAVEASTEAVEAFLAARGDENWPRVCAQLARSMLAKLEHLAVSTTELDDKSCPAFLAAFTRLSAKERESSVVKADLREEGQRAFLIYSGDDEIVYAMPLNQEGEAWKIASLSPQRLG